MEEENKKKDKETEQNVVVPAKFKTIITEIEKMTVIDLNELVEIFEKKFNVSAQIQAGGGASGDDAAGGEGEESATVTIELADVGEQKIAVIKAIKEILGVGLKEAKDLTDAAPSIVKEGVARKDSDEIKAKLEAAGAKVNIK